MNHNEENLKHIFKLYGCIPGGTKEASIRLRQILKSRAHTMTDDDILLLRRILDATFLGNDMALPELYKCGGDDCYAISYPFCRGEMEACEGEGTISEICPYYSTKKIYPHYSPEDK